MTQPRMHATSSTLLQNIKSNLPQSLLLSGPEGVGLRTIAHWLAEGQIASELQPFDTKGAVDTKHGTISVEMIRRLYEQTRGIHTKNQILLIDNADRMSHAAQGAFLKLLEEPNAHIHFLLTSHHPQQLLPTIRSRVQHITINPLAATDSTEFITSLGITDTTKHAQLQFIAGGLPAKLTRLIQDEAYFQEYAGIISDARDFLRANPYDKLQIVHAYRTDRSKALLLIDSALQILRTTISANPQPKLLTQIGKLLIVREHINSNYNVALQLAKFVL